MRVCLLLFCSGNINHSASHARTIFLIHIKLVRAALPSDTYPHGVLSLLHPRSTLWLLGSTACLQQVSSRPAWAARDFSAIFLGSHAGVAATVFFKHHLLKPPQCVCEGEPGRGLPAHFAKSSILFQIVAFFFFFIFCKRRSKSLLQKMLFSSYLFSVLLFYKELMHFGNVLMILFFWYRRLLRSLH